MQLPPNSIIVSGPVIIENGKVLLNREKKPDGETPWLFPGGEVEDFDQNLEEACTREIKEEMGIDVDITRPLRTIMLHKDDRVIFLVHYLAKRVGEIKPAENIVEWAWHDINNLPENCAENVIKIINDIK